MQLERVNSLTVNEFVHDFVAASRPCIITDGMRGWPGADLWSPDYFKQQFGSEIVQIYNDRFDLETVGPLSDYFDKYFYSRTGSGLVPYVRWYSKLKDVDFLWADDAFEKLKGQWSNPYFMPDTGFLLPYCMPPNTITPVDVQYPARSVFISGPGAFTRLHYDPWGSDSILFQIHGDKKWVLYSPDQAAYLRNPDGSYADLSNPDLSKFPDFHKAKPTYEFHLRTGDTMFVPAGWIHEVETVEGSISLTWNFVHRVRLDYFLSYLASNEPVGHDLEVLRFFFAKQVPPDAEAADIASFIKRNLTRAEEASLA